MDLLLARAERVEKGAETLEVAGQKQDVEIKQRDQTIGELLLQPRGDRVEDFTSQPYHIIVAVVIRGMKAMASMLHPYLQ